MSSEIKSQGIDFFAGSYDSMLTGNSSYDEKELRVSCLCTAIQSGNKEVVESLLLEGFDVNETVDFSDEDIYIRPLSVAILSEKIDIARLLIEKGAEVGNVPYELPLHGMSAYMEALKKEATKAIAEILVNNSFQGIRDRIQDSLSKQDYKVLFSQAYAKSPLTAACYIKSRTMIEILLDAGAEFGDYLYRAIGAVLSDDKPCSDAEKKELVDLVLYSRNQIGFDRFVEPTENFEQHINGEWRRSVDDDSFNPAMAAQMRAWQACGKLLTSRAYGKRLPVSQLLYKKYCETSVDYLLGRIKLAAESIDSSESISDLIHRLALLNTRFFWLPAFLPFATTVVTQYSTNKSVVASFVRFIDSDDTNSSHEWFETIVLPMMQADKPGVELNYEEYRNTLNEIAFVGKRSELPTYRHLALKKKHTLKEYRDMFGDSEYGQLLYLASLSLAKGLTSVADEYPIYFDKKSVKKAIDFLCDENLDRVKNFMKCNYAYSFTEMIISKTAEEKDAAFRFSGFLDACGDLITEELSPVYLESVLDEKAITELKELFWDIKSAYKRAIEQSGHLSKATRRKALEKLNDIDLEIVGTEPSKEKLGFKPIIDDWDFEDNINRLLILRENEKIIKLLEGHDDCLSMTSGKTWDYNAAYYPLENKVRLFGAYLLPPTYSSRRSSVMNYATIGRVIGHEISHAFDPQSIESLMAAGVKKRVVDIFSSSPDYAMNIEKLKVQFENQVPTRLAESNPLVYLLKEHDSEKWLGENFADIVGLEIALFAYALSCGYNSIEELTKKAPSDVRLFFESYALGFRAKPSIDNLERQVEHDVHAPDELRANTVKNIDAFHEIFGTKKGDGMWLNPSDRVSVFGIK